MFQGTQASSQYSNSSQPPFANNAALTQQTPRNQPQGGISYGQPSAIGNSASATSKLETSPALAFMGLPNSIHSSANSRTGAVEYFQTRLIEVELQRNEWGFGINLGDSNGIVRVQGCRSNPDGTPSPVQQNNLIQPGDVIYKVQNIILSGKDPLSLVGMKIHDDV